MIRPSRRDRGAVAHAFVISFTIIVGALVLASEAGTSAYHREVLRTGPSDEAFALAEAGVRLARAELARKDSTFTGLAEARLGKGTFSVAVERSGDSATVVATGTAAAPLTAGPGGRAIRKIRATLRLGGAQPVVTSWKEL